MVGFIPGPRTRTICAVNRSEKGVPAPTGGIPLADARNTDAEALADHMACCATATVGAETLEECALLADISVLAVGGHEPAAIQIRLKVENHRISGSLRLLTANGIQTENEKNCSGRGSRG